MVVWTVETRGEGEVVVALRGELTSPIDVEQILASSGRGAALDLAGVRRISSRGLNELLRFLDELGGEGAIDAHRVSVGIVTQLALVPALADRLRVRSLFVPWECLACFHETERLVDVPADGSRPALPPPPCPRCGADLEPAEPPDRYFAFLEG